MKVRLVKGPFGGQVKDINVPSGINEVIIAGPKKMTRQEKWEWMRDNQPNVHYAAMQGGPGVFTAHGVLPRVEALYRIAMRPHTNGHNMSMMPCMHPDGSLFYEYVEDSKRPR